MDSKPHYKLHIYFLPMMAPGHMIPMVEMARIFARRGVKATLVLTPVNATLVSKTIDRDRELGLETTIRLINFPSAEVGLPEGIENHSSITSRELSQKMYKATELLQQPFENLLEEDSPDCLVADLLFPWASEVATKHGIPRLAFHESSACAVSVYRELSQYKPYKNVESDSEVFVVPGLPNKIMMTRHQLPDFIRDGTENQFTKLIEKVMELEVTSYGVLINRFHELEPAYSEHYSKVIGKRVRHVGPVSLCNRDNKDKTHRGSTISINEHECLTWLDSKEPNSVLYVCLGSLSQFSNVQLLEIAMGAQEWCRWPEDGKIYVKREDIEKAVVQLMVCEEAEGIRSRARAPGETAKKAVEKGGSSYNYLSALLEELELNTN
ncbi:hypothetical protein RHSIM_Rhsim11G0161400 [Rhododendron simsii]|uniref:Uncharacterized protein n=1 Tax=Rhododendron simsii TaxID=118357 RepID=A0A834GBI6_RHOSS|nr:hypothetical protein RHSIM_Rhsim11G0161400 [Rhododendron simsii]